MRDILFYILLLLGTVCVSCTREFLPDEQHIGDMTGETGGDEYARGCIFVKFDDEMTGLIEDDLAGGGVRTRSSGLNGLVDMLGVKSISRVFPYAGQYEKRTRAEGLHRWYVIEYDTTMVMTKASAAFNSLPGVEIVEPVWKAVDASAATDFFNDPYLNMQWHYYNDGTYGSGYVAGEDINVLPVWQKYTTGSDKVIVAVCDGGVDQNHEDLQGNLIGGKNYVSPQKPVEPSYHGTHVAGTIAAVNNNGIGVCGIAGGDAANGVKGVKIWSAQVLGAQTNSQLCTGLKEGADYGAVISQNSWEYASGGAIPQLTKDAVDYFIKYAGCDNEGNQLPDSPMKGGVVIFAAGNSSSDSGKPAEYEPIIAVGALNHKGEKAGYSNYGDWVDICAPGGNGSSSFVRSTVNYNRYAGTHGTSMACPHVSGVAALLVSYYGGPGFTNEMLEEKLLKGGRVRDFGRPFGVQLDALGSFEYGSLPPEQVDELNVSVASNTIELTFDVTADPDSGKAFRYVAVASRMKVLLNDGLDLKNLPPGVLSASVPVGGIYEGEEISLVLDGLEYGSVYYVAVFGLDCYGNASKMSPVYEAATDSNRPPVIMTRHGDILAVSADRTCQLVFTISDPDGDRFTVAFEPGSDAASCRQNLNGECIVTITGFAAVPGMYEARITATDEAGASASAVLAYQII